MGPRSLFSGVVLSFLSVVQYLIGLCELRHEKLTSSETITYCFITIQLSIIVMISQSQLKRKQ